MIKTERLAKAKQTRLLNQTLASKTEFTDEEKLSFSSTFKEWASCTSFVVNETVQYLGEVYEVLQAHTRQDDWTPDISVSLFRHITYTVDTETGETVEEYTVGKSYMIGDKVSFNDIIYVSVIDNNVWSPEGNPQGWEVEIEV